MKTIIILLLSLSYLPCAGTAYAQGAAEKTLDLASAPASGLKLQAAGVAYAGAEASAGDVCLHADGVESGGRTFYWSDAQLDGLFVEDRLRGVSKVYQPYKLARRAGWYEAGDGSEESEPNNNIWGLFVSEGKVWMGTNGLGVLVLDPGREEWSRYDWQREAAPDTRTDLVYVDGRHMFVNRLGSLYAYSLEKGVGVRLPFAGDGSGEVKLVDEWTYSIEFRAYGRGKQSYTVGVAQLEAHFSQLARYADRRHAADYTMHRLASREATVRTAAVS
jgi:hypothetical protein